MLLDSVGQEFRQSTEGMASPSMMSRASDGRLELQALGWNHLEPPSLPHLVTDAKCQLDLQFLCVSLSM